MEYDFRTNTESLRIPSEVYLPVKRCPFCQSVYITDKLCEACGSSMHYHPIGTPFGAKSLYGMKERYIEKMNGLNRFFPVFENKKSKASKSYMRNLEKRFSDLISAFNTPGVLKTDERKFFYIESREIVDEMLRFGASREVLQLLVEENDNSLLGQELLYYIKDSVESIKVDPPWIETMTNYRFWGLVRVEFILKSVLIMATVLTAAIGFKDILSSQFGK